MLRERFIKIENARLGQSWLLDDPVNFPDAEVTRRETIRATIDAGDLGNLITFQRQDTLGNERELDESTAKQQLDQCSGNWYAALNSSGMDNDFPYALAWLSSFRGLAPIRESEVKREQLVIANESIEVLAITRRLSPGRKGRLYFDVADGAPVGLEIEVNTFELPGQEYQSPNDVPSDMRHTFFGSHRLVHWLSREGDSYARVAKTTDSEALDGTVQHWIEDTVISKLDFQPNKRSLGVPRSLGDGIVVKIQSAPQIQAEWRDGKVVKVFRGKVVEELGKARMRGAFPVWAWILLSVGVLTVAAFAVLQWGRSRHDNPR